MHPGWRKKLILPSTVTSPTILKSSALFCTHIRFVFLGPEPAYTLPKIFTVSPSFLSWVPQATLLPLQLKPSPGPGSWFLQKIGFLQLSQPAPLAPFHPLKSPRQFVDSAEFRPPASDYNCASDCQG